MSSKKLKLVINILRKLTKIIKNRNKKPKSPILSYSYDGEDVILKKILTKKSGFYVDIGCNHPFKHSNTYYLYKQKWKGINIDANPQMIKLFNKKRKNDINLNVGIGTEKKKELFYISENDLLSSFNKQVVIMNKEKWGFDYTEMVIEVDRLENILDKFLDNEIMNIDFMNIDVEGLEMEVLLSNNWDKFKPTILAIEHHGKYLEDVMKDILYLFIVQKGYRLIAKTNITLIFERVYK